MMENTSFRSLLLGLVAAVSCLDGQAADLQAKFQSLFDGKSLAGWEGAGYHVEGGQIVCTPQGRNLVSKGTYANYVLDFEFQLTPGSNNGLGIHYPGNGEGAYTGMELQILDDTAPKYADLKDYQFHGGLYTMAAAKRGALRPVGQWNQQRVTVMGPVLVEELNGQEILRVNLDEMSARFPGHQGVKRRSGHLALLGHGDRVAFRAIRIAELPPAANVAGVKAAGFVPMFDGATLNGWRHRPGSVHWLAIPGIIKHDGQKGPAECDLWTERTYGDFTMVFDWRWSGRGPRRSQPVVLPDGSENGRVEIEEFDSGIYLRGDSKSQVNLWNWPIGSGEVYGYRTDPRMPPEIKAGVTPKVRADRPIGEWNRMMIKVKGERLNVILNGQAVIIDARLPGIPPKGAVGLQTHGSAIDFANLWIKEE